MSASATRGGHKKKQTPTEDDEKTQHIFTNCLITELSVGLKSDEETISNYVMFLFINIAHVY